LVKPPKNLQAIASQKTRQPLALQLSLILGRLFPGEKYFKMHC